MPSPASPHCCREEELETAQFAATEAQTEMAHMLERMAEARRAQAEAEGKADRAIAALDGVKAEAAKAAASAGRHQQVGGGLVGQVEGWGLGGTCQVADEAR